jgi:hypothetical protein
VGRHAQALDEAFVDLQAADEEALEVGQGVVPGPEVVGGDLDAQRPQLGERLVDEPRAALQHRRLGDLHGEDAGGMPAPATASRTVSTSPGSRSWRREVQGHEEVERRVAPAHRRSHGLVEEHHPESTATTADAARRCQDPLMVVRARFFIGTTDPAPRFSVRLCRNRCPPTRAECP